eukprot:GFUD01040488.1.p1 GENE.GFUD01040488.1~~GFUD01040488.1.p1  ORF type:complete len:524 (-),score=112.02 GFUD01040488.1:144-1715(-)
MVDPLTYRVNSNSLFGSKGAVKNTKTVKLAVSTASVPDVISASTARSPDVPASISDMLLMEKYGMLPGCLKKAYTEKTKSPSFVVQVLSVRSRCLQISDGLHTIFNCIAYCDIKDINSGNNPIIKVIQWSLVQMTRSESSSVSTDKPQYGMRLDKYSIIENDQPLPIIGRPKLFKVTIFKEPKLQLEGVVNFYLKHLNLKSANPSAEYFQQWVRSICQVMRRAENGWFCGICGKFLSTTITSNAVSHIQKHYREFPGYKCPTFGCFSPNLRAFQQHLNLKMCSVEQKDTSVEAIVPVKEAEKEVPRFDIDVYESPEQNFPDERKSKVTKVSTNILKSLDSHFLSSEQIDRQPRFEEFCKDFSGKISENQEKTTFENDEIVILEEIDHVKQTLENNNKSLDSHFLSSEQSDTQPSFEDLWKDFSDKIDENQEKTTFENDEVTSFEDTNHCAIDESNDNDELPSPPSKKHKMLPTNSEVSQTSKSNDSSRLEELSKSSRLKITTITRKMARTGLVVTRLRLLKQD